MIANINATGILDENRSVKSTSVYPNPSNGIVHVTNDGQKTGSVKLFNLQGVLIQEFFANDFSVANLTAGIYFIIIQTDRSTFTHKFVKL